MGAPETPVDAGTLYDRYLADCLAGKAESPVAFCERHGMSDATLFARLEALYNVVARPGTLPASGPSRLPPEEGLPVERVGEFRLLRHLDKGGMGLVFLAEQESLGRLVAVKLIRPELRASASAVERFRREARAAARLRHQNIVPIHAFGEEAGHLYLAMEFVPGNTLDRLLAEARASGEPVAPARAAAWARDLARALHAAHEEGIVHRDVKPSNVLVAADGRPMLLDFGVARDDTIEGPSLTTTFAGTPHYAAPEQLLSRASDRRSDVYGLGATLYECLVGRTPFAGETLGDLVAKSTAFEPVSPRRIDPRIPRDLEIIVMKALDRDPARPYATAAAFADDLEALLEFRPISARGAGPLVRARRWCRRRPAAAATVATVALALVAGALLLVVQRGAEAERTRRSARGLVAEARARLDDYRTNRAATALLDREVSRLARDMGARYTTAEEDRLLQEREDEILNARRAREGAAYGILDLVRQAERLDPAVHGAEAVRAELYAEKWREARDAGDPVAERLYREMVERRKDHLSASPLDTVRVEWRTDPKGAEVHVFRCVDLAELVPGGDHRLVPVPLAGADPRTAPGEWVLRVVKGAGGLRPDDLILRILGLPVRGTLFALEGETLWRVVSIGSAPVGEAYDIEAAQDRSSITLESPLDGTRAEVGPDRFDALRLLSPAEVARRGGVVATVYRDGEAVGETLPPGLDVRATAAAPPLSARSLAGLTPLPLDLEQGRLLVLLRLEGHETRRIALTLDVHSLDATIVLARAGTTPAGFVPLSPVDPNAWIMEREVTCADYLEFLNDPEAGGRAGPRSGSSDTKGLWPKDGSGRYVLASGWKPDWPIIGLSWPDANAYAAYRTARARREGRSERYTLPTGGDWQYACGGWSARNYPFGDRFRPKWVKCCFARKQATPEPILRFPIDESPVGVFDVCGGAREWLDDWYDEGRRMRRLGGGSWATGDPELLKMWGIGALEEDANGENGFRLVLRREPE